MRLSKYKSNGYWVFSIVLFLIVFNPPFVKGLSFTMLLTALAAVYCIFNGEVVRAILRNRIVKKILSFFYAFAAYNLLFSMINYARLSNPEIGANIIEFFVGYVSLFFISLALVTFVRKNNGDLPFFIKSYILAGLYQSVIAIACLLSPPLKSFFNTMVMQNGSSDKISRIMEYGSIWRNYGFAATLYDIFGMTMSVLTILAVVQAFKGKKVYFIPAAMMAVTAIINARSSFFLIGVGFFVILFSVHGKITAQWITRRVLFVIVAIMGLGAILTWILDNQTSEQLEWLATAITETSSMRSGNATGYYDTLMNDFIFFPEDMLSVIFGTSMNPLQAIKWGTDVGYVQYIWYYGIVGSFIMYYFYYQMLHYSMKATIWPESKMYKAILFMIAVYLVKLTCLGYSMTSVIFVPLCLYAISSRNKTRQASVLANFLKRNNKIAD